jgi:cytochrome c
MNRHSFLKSIFAGAVLLLAATHGAHAQSKGTRAEAEAMVGKTVAYIKANGTEKAYNEVTNGTTFKDRDLYVLIYDLNGKNLAHGANAKLVGKDLIGLKDPDGKLPTQLLVAVAKEKGKGWSEEFKFRNPTTNNLQRRVVYVERLGDTLIGSGVFLD